MKKTFPLICLSIISVLIIGYYFCFGSKRFNQYVLNNKEYAQVISLREKSNISFSISFDGYELIQDNCGNYYYSLIEGSDSRYNPKVLISDSNYDIAFCDSVISDELIKNNKHIKFIVYSKNDYNEFNLICTTLPIMTINNDSEIIGSEDCESKLFLFDNRENAYYRNTISNASIHERGQISIVNKYEKKNYKISLKTQSLGNNKRKNNLSLLGLRNDDDYILYSCFDDPEKVRKVFSSNLWEYSCAKNNSFGVDNGYEYRFIELIINGNYQGLYALGYKIDEKTVELEDGEIMYSKYTRIYNELTSDFEEESVDGYVIENDYSDEYDWEPLLEYYRVIKMFEGNNIHFEFQEDYIDYQNQIDIYLFINLIQGVDHACDDGSLHNIFISAKKSGNWYKMLYTPWDMDRTWGLDDFVEGNNPKHNTILKFSMAENLLYRDYFIDDIKKRYSELRETYWSEEYLISLLDQYENQIYYSGAFQRDQDRWPSSIYTNAHYSNNEDALSLFKEYVKERIVYMDNYVYTELGN